MEAKYVNTFRVKSVSEGLEFEANMYTFGVKPVSEGLQYTDLLPHPLSIRTK